MGRKLILGLVFWSAFLGWAGASEQRVANFAFAGPVVIGGQYFAAGLEPGTGAEAWARAQPAVNLEILAPAAAVGEEKPPILAFYSTPTGLAVDPSTLVFSRGGERLEMSCAALEGSAESGAECVPLLPLDDGEVTIEATVADVAGNLSPVAASRFRVDTAEPRLDFITPEEGFLAGRPSIRIEGFLSEEATLKLGEQPVEVGPGKIFSLEVPLQEGPNVLIFTATDEAGNATVAVLTGLADTRPPPPVAPEAIATTRHGARIELAGAPGAAEAEARVRWRNQRTGQEVETLAASDGSFETALAGAEGDLLVALVVDALDNTSPATEFPLVQPAPADPADPVEIAATAEPAAAPLPASVATSTSTEAGAAAAGMTFGFTPETCTSEGR